MSEWVVDIRGLKNCFAGQWVHEDVNLQLAQGEIGAIIGGSGTGKTTILRSLLTLLTPTDGELFLFGVDVMRCSHQELLDNLRQIGMLFQRNALFSGLSVLENIMFPLRKFTNLPEPFIEKVALLKLLLVGLRANDAHKMPSQISGGMQKRAAAASALSLAPKLLLLDEPLSGLDPHSARAFDELLLFLRAELGLSILMVSHDLASLERAVDKVFFLGEGRVLVEGSLAEVMAFKHPLISDYFHLDKPPA